MGDVIAGVILGGVLQLGFILLLFVSAMMEPPQVEPFQADSRRFTPKGAGRSSGRRIVRDTAEVGEEKRAA
jgi:hypothetical protein